MNKLLQIKQAWIKENEDYFLGWGLSMEVIESIGDDIVKNAVEYAESVVPEAKDMIYPLGRRADGSYIITKELKNKNDLAFQYNMCRSQTLRRIDEDSQSLNN